MVFCLQEYKCSTTSKVESIKQKTGKDTEIKHFESSDKPRSIFHSKRSHRRSYHITRQVWKSGAGERMTNVKRYRLGGSWFKASPDKKLARLISTYKMDRVVCGYGPSYLEI
jgi:hypothetical protein